MKKKFWIIAAIVALAALFIPIKRDHCRFCNDTEYRALTYTIVDWNHIGENTLPDTTKVYWFPKNFKSQDELWDYETPIKINKFVAIVKEISEDYVLVQPAWGAKGASKNRQNYN